MRQPGKQWSQAASGLLAGCLFGHPLPASRTARVKTGKDNTPVRVKRAENPHNRYSRYTPATCQRRQSESDLYSRAGRCQPPVPTRRPAVLGVSRCSPPHPAGPERRRLLAAKIAANSIRTEPSPGQRPLGTAPAGGTRRREDGSDGTRSAQASRADGDWDIIRR